MSLTRENIILVILAGEASAKIGVEGAADAGSPGLTIACAAMGPCFCRINAFCGRLSAAFAWKIRLVVVFVAGVNARLVHAFDVWGAGGGNFFFEDSVCGDGLACLKQRKRRKK